MRLKTRASGSQAERKKRSLFAVEAVYDAVES
jgi:hypothetical protein